jgi:hypothetical protein
MAAHAVGDLGYIGDFMPGGRPGGFMTGKAGISVQIGGVAILAGFRPSMIEREGVRLAKFCRGIGRGIVAGGAVGAKQALVEGRVGVTAYAGRGCALEYNPRWTRHVTFITIYLLVRPGQRKS